MFIVFDSTHLSSGLEILDEILQIKMFHENVNITNIETTLLQRRDARLGQQARQVMIS